MNREPRTTPSNTVDRFEDIRDLVKVGKNGTTFHRPDGKFLSRHELAMIRAHAELIRSGQDTESEAEPMSSHPRPQRRAELWGDTGIIPLEVDSQGSGETLGIFVDRELQALLDDESRENWDRYTSALASAKTKEQRDAAREEFRDGYKKILRDVHGGNLDDIDSVDALSIEGRLAYQLTIDTLEKRKSRRVKAEDWSAKVLASAEDAQGMVWQLHHDHLDEPFSDREVALEAVDLVVGEKRRLFGRQESSDRRDKDGSRWGRIRQRLGAIGLGPFGISRRERGAETVSEASLADDEEPTLFARLTRTEKESKRSWKKTVVAVLGGSALLLATLVSSEGDKSMSPDVSDNSYGGGPIGSTPTLELEIGTPAATPEWQLEIADEATVAETGTIESTEAHLATPPVEVTSEPIVTPPESTPVRTVATPVESTPIVATPIPVEEPEDLPFIEPQEPIRVDEVTVSSADSNKASEAPRKSTDQESAADDTRVQQRVIDIVKETADTAVRVEYGSSITNEIIEYAAQHNIVLSPEAAAGIYESYGGDIYIEGLDQYILPDGEVGIASAGIGQWNQDFKRHMDTELGL